MRHREVWAELVVATGMGRQRSFLEGSELLTSHDQQILCDLRAVEESRGTS